MYPRLPAPAPGSSYEENQSDVALRRIRENLEVEAAPANRRRHRVVAVVSFVAAWSAVAILIADLGLGLYQWPL